MTYDIQCHLKKPLNNGEFYLDVCFGLNFGECIALFGKSGAGKSTILRLLSGLDRADSESFIRVGKKAWLDSQICLPPQKRKIGFVFQNYTLFPHLNVYKNILFSAKNKQDKLYADELLSLMELESLKNAPVTQLSGGQAQRVALARALVYRPDILLLDEPFSALDSTIALSLQQLIKTLHQHYKLTIILVSHNIADLFSLAQRGYVLEKGQIIKQGTIKELFSTHQNKHNSESRGIPLLGVIVEKQLIGQIWHFSVLCHGEIIQITQPMYHDSVISESTPSTPPCLIDTNAHIGQSVIIYTYPMSMPPFA